MTTSEPSTDSAPRKELPAVVRALLFFTVLGAIVGGVYLAFAKNPSGGSLELGTQVTSDLGNLSDVRTVPGRPHENADRAHVWRIDLRAGEPVTINTCASQRGSRSSTVTAQFLVHGPAGENDNLKTRAEVTTLPPGQVALVYTPTSSGEHSIWVYKAHNRSSYSYHLEVLPGAQPEPPVDLCLTGW